MLTLVQTTRRLRLLRLALCCAVLQCCAAFSLRAQFVTSPNDAATLRWMSIKSRHFEVIYPVNCDTLARSYMLELEMQRMRVASSLGLASGGKFKKDSSGARVFVPARLRPLPVVLHTQNVLSNGAVTWAPRRMELNTVPEWMAPSAMPWRTMLSIHEGRHAAQMQNGYRNVFRPFGWLLGQMSPSAAAAWPGHAGLEGDAVVAETALTAAGRGRESDFLMQYFYSYENADPRNRMRWRLGSYYHVTPDHYSWGYFMLSGIMAGYNDPLFPARYMDYVSRRPYDPWPMRHNLRRVSGVKFGESYKHIWATHYDAWLHSVAARGPYTMYYEHILKPTPRRYTVYENPNPTPDGKYLWVKRDLYHQPAVYVVDSTGKEKRLWAINPVTGKMNYEESDSVLLWNEVRPDPRWGQRSHSIVRQYDFRTGKRSRKSSYGIYLYPIQICRDTIVAIHYMSDGREHIDLLNGKTKKPIAHWHVPVDKQVVEINHLGKDIYVAAVCDKGFGIWQVRNMQWREVLPPIPVRIGALEHDGEYLTFESEHSGVREMYRVDPRTSQVWQLTNSRYGGTAFSFCDNGDIIFSQTGLNGDVPMRVKAKDVLNIPVKWEDYYRHPIADTLSAQALRLQQQPLRHRYYYPRKKAAADSAAMSQQALLPVPSVDSAALAKQPAAPVDPSLKSASVTDSAALAKQPAMPAQAADSALEISAPKRYRKAAHSFHFHSWVPAYIDLDVIQNLSYDNIRHVAKLGLMGFYQNSMSTLFGNVGYKAEPVDGTWYHSGHFNITYRGLYPVFELNFHVGEGDAVNNVLHYTPVPGGYKRQVVSYSRQEPFINTDFKCYIPWQWSNGVYSIGLIPQVGVAYTNDTYDDNACVTVAPALRSYIMQPTPYACIYPRWGIGAEFRWMQPCCVGAKWIQPKAYAYVYGYVPGIGWGQGLRLTAAFQKDFTEGTPVYRYGGLNMLPRGICNIGGNYQGAKLTLDYAAPFYMGDWNISELFYCTRGVFTPHFDYSWIVGKGDLWSVGATFEMEFGSFFWIRVPISIGVTYSYNDGPGFTDGFETASHNYVGATFNIELPL